MTIRITSVSAAPVATKRFRGIRVTDPHGRAGLANPERGWRLEHCFGHGPGPHVGIHRRPRWLKDCVASISPDRWWELEAQRYAFHGLSLVQGYCYLHEFLDGPISDEKLGWIQQSFDRLRGRGLKVLLRFAYEYEYNLPFGPTFATIFRHLDQLQPLLRRNADLIAALQAGFIGIWGEWHGARNGLQRDDAGLSELLGRLLDILPADRMIQVRVPRYKRRFLQRVSGTVEEVTAETAHSGAPHARIGFHNDGFLGTSTDGNTWPEAPHYAAPGNPEFDYKTRESAYVPVDGELFHCNLTATEERGQFEGPHIDPLAAARRMRLHHYDTFSIAHSASAYEGDGSPHTIDHWITSVIREQALEADRLPVSSGYFDDGSAAARRTAFEYIRDHLGYRIELQELACPARAGAGEPFTVKLTLINRGFSAFYNPRPVFFVLLGADDRVIRLGPSAADPRTWQPYDPTDSSFTPKVHEVTCDAVIPPDTAAGTYPLCLWLPDASPRLQKDSRYAVRVANGDVPWWTDVGGRYGLNVLGVVRVDRRPRADGASV